VKVVGTAGRICRTDFVYVTLCQRTQQIFLTFRGTSNMGGWVSNAAGKLPEWLTNLPDLFASEPYLGDSINVHSGFLDGYTHMRKKILQLLQTARKECPECSLLVTGHSRGGFFFLYFFYYYSFNINVTVFVFF
jgi:hypothetical protein